MPSPNKPLEAATSPYIRETSTSENYNASSDGYEIVADELASEKALTETSYATLNLFRKAKKESPAEE
ncbi:SNF2-family ATP dependent chromatin remodeling factor snf21, partial [Corchorus olitorius]